MNFHAQRRQALARNLKKDGLDAVLVTDPVNVTYLTNFTGGSSYYAAAGKDAVLVTDTRFEAQVREECPNIATDGEVGLHVRPHTRTTLEAAAEVLAKLGAKTVAVEGSRLPVGDLEALQGLAPKLTFVSVPHMVESLRVIKDASEVEKIKDAVRVAERAFRMFVATLRETDTEKEMADTIDAYLRRAGARGSAFPPIVAVGERGALPHAPPSTWTPGEASKLLIDLGADCVYKSDITRTIRSPFVTTPTRRNKFERVGYDLDEVYAVVLEAQNAALATIRHGVKAKDVDAAARKVFASAKLRKGDGINLADCFTHGLGHGIGLEVHEAPRVRANSEDVLESGMVITLEPAVYIPGWGGVRIEDDVLVQREGCQILTSLPRELAPVDHPIL